MQSVSIQTHDVLAAVGKQSHRVQSEIEEDLCPIP